MTDPIKKIIIAAMVVAASAIFGSCDSKDPDLTIDPDEEGIRYTYPGNRVGHLETRRVLLFYECGHNSLYTYLADNMEKDIPEGYLPGNGRNDNVVLIYSKLAQNLNYKNVPSYLRRVYKDQDGNFVSDTLKTYDQSKVACSGDMMREVLSYVQSNFPAKGYGMVFASHGSGWLPEGYYNNPSQFERNHKKVSDGRKLSNSSRLLGVPEGNMETDDPYAHMVRSIGQEKTASRDIEMSITEFADGIPFHLDYLLFDMCFGGGIEVAYALKDKADYLGVSPAEVLAAGMFDYTKLLGFLLNGSSPDLQGLFKDSFDRYDKQTGDYRSATVTLVRTAGLDGLSSACKSLISKYSDAIAAAPASSIQGYFRQNRHYFYDLEDIFVKSGVPDSDMAQFRSALQECIVYKAATPRFINTFDIKTYSGFSMYLPCAGTALLDSYYLDEPWNKAVELVK